MGRPKGVSLTTIDALIAAIALEYRASVFTLDKDFSRIARLTGFPLHPCLQQVDSTASASVWDMPTNTLLPPK